MSASKLYLIVTYFNFTDSKKNKERIKVFLEEAVKYPNVELILSEGIFSDVEPLPDFSSSIYKHLKYNYTSKIWIKENLINLAISTLPEDWEFVSWIDKDISFENKDWAEKTIKLLGEKGIIQPWSSCIFLDAEGEPDVKAHEYFKNIKFNRGLLADGIGSYCGRKHKGLDGHPGQCWAINKKTYLKIGKLMDICIVGGGDGAIYTALNNNFNTKLYDVYGCEIYDYILNFMGVELGYLDEKITHSYHGDISDRQYTDRLKILSQYGFNPRTDIGYTQEGLIYLENKELENSILDYFYSRNEP
jgi:hypothetical protein